MHAIAAYGGLQQAMRPQENKTMSINPVRRPLSVATPSAPPPVFAITSGYELRSIPAEAYERRARAPQANRPGGDRHPRLDHIWGRRHAHLPPPPADQAPISSRPTDW